MPKFRPHLGVPRKMKHGVGERNAGAIMRWAEGIDDMRSQRELVLSVFCHLIHKSQPLTFFGLALIRTSLA